MVIICQILKNIIYLSNSSPTFVINISFNDGSSTTNLKICLFLTFLNTFFSVESTDVDSIRIVKSIFNALFNDELGVSLEFFLISTQRH